MISLLGLIGCILGIIGSTSLVTTEQITLETHIILIVLFLIWQQLFYIANKD